jgi:hypothetical protein
LDATIPGQIMITKQQEISHRFLRAQNVSRSLVVEYETLIGSEVGVGLEAMFAFEPAPHTGDVNEAQAYSWLNNADQFIGNLLAILDICNSVRLKGV